MSKALREQVVFARHNVMSDPPFSRMDLISCRNLLIYLEPELQKKIMPAFHYALKPGGLSFPRRERIGRRFTELFAPADKKQKIFAKNAVPTPAFRLSSCRASVPAASPGGAPSRRRRRERRTLPEGLHGELNAEREADRISLSQFAPPGVIINGDAASRCNSAARRGAYLEPPTGKASFDLLKMASEGLMLPLRAAVKKAKRENKPVRREGVHVARMAARAP